MNKAVNTLHPRLAPSAILSVIAACLQFHEEIEFDLWELIDVEVPASACVAHELALRSHRMRHVQVRFEANEGRFICRWGSCEEFDGLELLKTAIQADIRLLRQACVAAAWSTPVRSHRPMKSTNLGTVDQLFDAAA